jgi:hypothetical protein
VDDLRNELNNDQEIEDFDLFKNEAKISELKFATSININLTVEKKDIKKDSSPKKAIKRKKIDLNTTPIPLFECIYCSNEKIPFKYMSQNIISDKYLYNCSPIEYQNISIIISSFLIYNFARNYKINSIVNMIVNYTEYLNKSYQKNSSEQYLKAYSQNIKKNEHKFKPYLKYKLQSADNNTMTLFFKNTSK